MRKKGCLFLSFTILFTIFILAEFSQAQPEKSANNILFILDASGSMWGQINGENKIVIARRVMKNLLNQLDDGTNVGLVAYGHRREKDCEDIEVVKPIAALDRVALAQQIDGLNPKGKTPITGSVNLALDAISSVPEGATIILVSDGIESCAGDPCQTVSKAKATGAKFVMHIVGFDVSKEDVAQLECAAQVGGGLYFNAENADDLAAAIDQAVAPVDSSDSAFSIKTLANGELVDAMVKVFPAGKIKEVAGGRTYSSSSTNPRIFPLKAGIYNIEVQPVRLRGVDVRKISAVVLRSGETVEKIIDFSFGELSIKVTRNGNLSDATINVYNAGTRKSVAGGRSYKSASSNPKIFKIPPGKYDVVIGSVEMSGKVEHKLEGVIVAPQKRTEESVNFESGELRVGAVLDDALIDVIVKVVNSTGKQVAGGRTYSSASSNPKSFDVEPGSYSVTLQSVKLKNPVKKTIEMTITASKTIERIIDFGK